MVESSKNAKKQERRQYSISQLYGKSLVDILHPVRDDSGNWNPVFELKGTAGIRRVLESSGIYPDNSFFWQLRECIRETIGDSKATHDSNKSPSLQDTPFDPVSDDNELCLERYIYFVNFKGAFRDYKLSSDWNEKRTFSKEEWGKASFDRKCHALFNRGFTVKYNENDRIYDITYVPFDKSNSMARESRITFIDKRLFDNMNKRIMLDYKFEGVDINLSKLYAYRGLSLSNARRVEFDHAEDSITGEKLREHFVLNERTVCVVKNEEYPLMLGNVYTAVQVKNPLSEEDGLITYRGLNGSKESARLPNYTRFDGEGLISERYAKFINNSLRKNENEKRSSFQIRGLPFMKGMLHTVDFHGFILYELEYSEKLKIAEEKGKNIREFVPDDADNKRIRENAEAIYKQLYIKDYFGKARRLSEVEIIVSDSMFKCASWLKKMKTEYFERCSDDPLKDYFAGVDKYRYTLYIANTDYEITRGESIVRLNYQFLNTLKLERSSLEKLVNHQFNVSKTLLTDVNVARQRLLITRDVNIEDPDSESYDESSEDGADKTNPAESFFEPWKAALYKNRDFLYHPKIQGQLRGVRNHLIINCGIGKIDVSGRLFFLSHDLLALLLFILQEYLFKDNKCEEPAFDMDVIEDLRLLTLKSGYFYTSNAELFRNKGIVQSDILKDDKTTTDSASLPYYSLLRSPHLSRNEQCLLLPYIPKSNDKMSEKQQPLSARDRIYTKFFGHLDGVVMVPYNSDVLIALGGADCDGDMVKVISEPIVNDAIFKGVYKNYEGNDELKRNEDYPVVSIPSDGNSKKGGRGIPKDGHIDYETIRNSFSGRIGIISNTAVIIGKYKYFLPDYMKNMIDTSKNSQKVADKDANLSKAQKTPNVFQKQISEVYEEFGESALNPAYYTIMTGLEIDAAKTGIHPSIPSFFIGKDYFFDSKKIFEELLKDRKQLYLLKSEFLKNEPEKEYSLKNTFNDEEVWYAMKLEEETPTIDALPYFTLKELNENDPNKNVKSDIDKKAIKYFTFQDDLTWRNKLDDEKREKVRALCNAYNKINRLAVNIYNEVKKYSNQIYIRYVYTLLKFRNGDLHDTIAFNTEQSTEEFVDTVFELFMEYFDEIPESDRLKRVSDMIVRIAKDYWYAIGSELDVSKDACNAEKQKWEREEFIENLFKTENESQGPKTLFYVYGNQQETVDKLKSVKSDIASLLGDFHGDGYMILYYILKDIQAMYGSSGHLVIQNKLKYNGMTDSGNTDAANADNDKPRSYQENKIQKYHDEVYNDFLDIFRKSEKKKYPRSKWIKEVELYIRNCLLELFGRENENIDDAFKYVASISLNHEVLWNGTVFKTEEVSRNIVDKH